MRRLPDSQMRSAQDYWTRKITGLNCTLVVHINGLPEPLILFAMAALAVHMHPFINMGAVQRRESVRFTKQTSFETN
ncbi:hypothetical protein DPMN_152107 [Dreissena polymorpha]|uniref:Uncharacterized protein n=1 Tax=Dreissena polymorpha TaxID=45954 RepID=A0A9D4FHP7_DREPO|nr:hypothetical protein DPMN_152107 [Dreissena polymorpha]